MIVEGWRLERIGEDGAFHTRLLAEGINTVHELLEAMGGGSSATPKGKKSKPLILNTSMSFHDLICFFLNLYIDTWIECGSVGSNVGGNDWPRKDVPVWRKDPRAPQTAFRRFLEQHL